jgi:hypothetical protein
MIPAPANLIFDEHPELLHPVELDKDPHLRYVKTAANAAEGEASTE